MNKNLCHWIRLQLLNASCNESSQRESTMFSAPQFPLCIALRENSVHNTLKKKIKLTEKLT